MAERLCFVQAPGSSGEEQGREFAERGWEVEHVDPEAPDALDRVVDIAPLATVFCLESDCGDTMGLAERLVDDERVSRPLIVFTGGTSEQVEQAKAAVPFAVFVNPSELHWVIKRLVFND